MINFHYQVYKIIINDLGFEFEKGIIDINYDDELIRFNYPMTEPISITLGKKFFENGQIILNLIIMVEVGKKYKKIARGDLKLLTKYFLEGKNIYENWINLKPFKKQIENLGIQENKLKEELTSGKIFTTIELKTPIENFQKKINLFPNPKNPIQEPTKNQFNDDLSDISISIVETKEEDREGLELEQFIEYEYIENLKMLLQNNYKNILPNDFAKLKQLNEILYGKFIDLSNSYNETLYSLASINEEIRQQAQKHYEDYKTLKKDIYNGRIELKKQDEILGEEVGNNNKENNLIKQDLEKYLMDKKKFVAQLDYILNPKKEKDIKMELDNNTMINMLNDIAKNGFDIFQGAELTEEEKKIAEDLFKPKN